MNMDLLSACESLACNVLEYSATDTSDLQIPESDVEHWQLLFQMTRAEAIGEIRYWRLDFSRESLSRYAWDAIKESDFAIGFTKESYEYSLARGWKLKRHHVTSTDDTGKYLLRIEEILPSIATIQDLLDTEKLDFVSGLDDDGNSVQFCYMSAQMRSLLLSRLASSDSIQFRPNFIRVSIAAKDLSADSRHPTLGIDSTLPQYRLQSNAENLRPAQNEYPVPYFFYGTLAEQAILARVLGISDHNYIKYQPATVAAAALTTWAGKYRSLVDGGYGDEVDGMVYLVKSREEEEALRIYETAKYEVVRCAIYFKGEAQSHMGLTFRLI